MAAKKQSFEEAIKNADEIILALEKGEMNLEEAMKKYKEASMLLAFCQKSLVDAEIEFTKISEEMNQKMEQSEK
ncbi:MAG: exodeoxyribonuclease VII small subunit [Culicoidibacterales bacterium]